MGQAGFVGKILEERIIGDWDGIPYPPRTLACEEFASFFLKMIFKDLNLIDISRYTKNT
jgi:hypothetical protein